MSVQKKTGKFRIKQKKNSNKKRLYFFLTNTRNVAE